MYQCDNSKVSCDNLVDESVSRKHCNSENEGEYEFADIHAAEYAVEDYLNYEVNRYADSNGSSLLIICSHFHSPLRQGC